MTDNFQRAIADLCAGLLRLSIHIAERGHSENVTAPVALAFSTIEGDQWAAACKLWMQHAPDLLQTLQVRSCASCDAPAGELLFTSYDGHAFHACSRCETWFVPRMVDWPLFEQFFQRCPEAAELARRANRDRLTNQADADLKRFRGYFNELSALVPSGKHRYLDVGASVGHSLTAAVDAGYEAHGIEADPDARHLARITHQGIVDDFARLPAIDYALISLWETLEHIASPLDVLQACAERLLPDGILVVTVPNLDATSTRLLREECSYVHGGFNQPGHINLFSRSSLESLFKRAGLRLLASDGLYSNDAITLLARLVRTSRGIGANDELNIDSALLAVLNAVGPAINIIEGLSGKQPILRCIAAREPVPESLRTRVDDWSQSRRAALAEEARGHLAGITDHLVHIKLLEQAVIERDRMLAEQTIAYSAEIEKRDKMLEKSNRMWPWLR